MKKLKCANCEKILAEDDDTFNTIENEVYCTDCYESAWEYPSTLFVFTPDGKNEVIRFNDKFGAMEDGSMPNPIKKQNWIQSDGWRGYTDWELNDGYIKLADGWVTGWPDESVTRKIELNEIFEDLKQGNIAPPCPIYWVFGITSNVFSTASMMATAERDAEKIKAWLAEIDGGIEGLKDMLS